MKHLIFMTWLAVLALSMAACLDTMNRENCDADDEDCIESCYIEECGLDAAKSLRKDGVKCRSMYWNKCVNAETWNKKGIYAHCRLGDYTCLDACFRTKCGVLDETNTNWSLCVDQKKDLCESSDFDQDWGNIDWGNIDWGSGGGGWDDDD